MDMQTEDQSLNASRVETIAAKTDVCVYVCVRVCGKPFAACAPQLEKGAFHMRRPSSRGLKKLQYANRRQTSGEFGRQTDGQTVRCRLRQMMPFN